MTKEVMQQALEALESDNPYIRQLAANAVRKAMEQPGQEPTPWRDMVVVSLVREGINKHKARELADHFAAQPVQEPLEQLRPAEFIQLTKGKEAVTGIPAYCWSEWLNKEQP
jgi:cytochrome c553